MVDHLRTAYPIEGCGVLVGKKTPEGALEIDRAVGTRNAEIQRGTDRYTIEPLDFLAIERELDKRQDGSRIVGFFHSHPDAPARPSSTDLEMAQGLVDVTQEFYIYAIVNIEKDTIGEIKFWQLSDDGKKFIQIQISKP